MSQDKDFVPTGNGAFELVKKEYIAELHSEAYLYRHKKTKARLFYIAADDNNKVFSVSFRTPPKNSTGVAHILEHSVLCGSRKFPLKEPFVELVKGSMNTFLNAMTFPDKTMYPVASKNDKDFRNLMDVYLDAVFHPNVINDPEIVKQEGWHYEIDQIDEPLSYKGVVYNEMKGVYSSPDSILEQHLMHELFPNTTYGVDSGGNPDNITDLTFEQFKEFYTNYYHPSNSFIFLYGKMDIEDNLTFIDREYLKDFDYLEVDSTIGVEKAFEEEKVSAFPYNISSEESEEGKSMHNLAYVLPEYNPTVGLALEVLTHAMIGSSAAPLKELLVKSGVGSDISGSFVDGLKQPFWSVNVTGSERDQNLKLNELVTAFLTEQCEKGFDKKSLEASLNNIEFILREADFAGRPMGLIYNIRLMDQWLYDNSPFEALRYEDSLKVLREGLQTDYYETIVKKHLLCNTHKALVTIYPEKGLSDKKEEVERKYLAEYKASLSKEEVEKLVEETKHLKERQASIDSEEALASIPLLELSDLKVEVEDIHAHIYEVEGVKIHHIPAFANGIGYSSINFGLPSLTEDEIPYAHLLTALFGRINTDLYTYKELDQETRFHLGGLGSKITAMSTERKEEEYKPFVSISGKALNSKLDKIWHFTENILCHSLYNNKERLKELIDEIKAIWDIEAFRQGNSIVTTRLLSQFSELGRFNDYGLLGYYQFITRIAKEGIDDSLVHKLETLALKIFTKDNMEVFFVGEDKDYEVFVEAAKPLLKTWKVGKEKKNSLVLTKKFKNQGIATSGQVQYVGQGGSYASHGYEYVGEMKVLETILKYEYLWTKVRVQGGAYGAFANFQMSGEVVFCSYRDPNLENTYKVYEEMADFVETFSVSDREMRKYIIGTMSSLDIPESPSIKLVQYMSRYYKGIDASHIEKVKREVVETNVEKIRHLAPLIRKVIADNHKCAMGNEEKIRKGKDLFDEVISLPS